MFYQDLEPVSKQLTIVIGLTVVGFMAFGLALSFYKNVLFEKTLEDIGLQNGRLQAEINQSQSNLEYYRSVQYKDKYAKENLGKLNPGEKLLIIAEIPRSALPTPEEAAVLAQRKQDEFEDILRQMPVLEHWNLYLFGKDRLEKLRSGLQGR